MYFESEWCVYIQYEAAGSSYRSRLRLNANMPRHCDISLALVFKARRIWRKQS